MTPDPSHRPAPLRRSAVAPPASLRRAVGALPYGSLWMSEERTERDRVKAAVTPADSSPMSWAAYVGMASTDAARAERLAAAIAAGADLDAVLDHHAAFTFTHDSGVATGMLILLRDLLADQPADIEAWATARLRRLDEFAADRGVPLGPLAATVRQQLSRRGSLGEGH